MRAAGDPTSGSPAAAFPWPAVMHAGLGLLRLSPKAFWAMTPLEFAAACGSGLRAEAAPARGELTALMQRYPDGGEQ